MFTETFKLTPVFNIEKLQHLCFNMSVEEITEEVCLGQ